jgi:hypothetical protein
MGNTKKRLTIDEVRKRVQQVDDYQRAAKARGEKMTRPKACQHFGYSAQSYTLYKRRLEDLQGGDEGDQIQMFDANTAKPKGVEPSEPKARRGRKPKEGGDDLLKAFMDLSAAQQKIINLQSGRH